MGTSSKGLVSSEMGRVFSFAEIVSGRDASVPVTDDGLLHAVPFIMVMTGKDRNNAGRDLRDLKDSIFHSTKIVERQLSTHGGPKTKLVSFRDAIELAMVLPGKVAKETRTKFTDIIHRYLAGDTSLIVEILENAASSSPIAQLARETLETTNVEIHTKRQLERDESRYEVEIAENKRRVVMIQLETQSAIVNTQLAIVNAQSAMMDAYVRLCPNQVLDDRARLMFKDNMLNLIMSTGPSLKTIQNGDQEVDAQEGEDMTISTFAMRQGKRYDNKALQSIGRYMSDMYKKRYGERASLHEQFTDGAVRDVRSYKKKDHDLLLEAFRLYDAGVLTASKKKTPSCAGNPDQPGGPCNPWIIAANSGVSTTTRN